MPLKASKEFGESKFFDFPRNEGKESPKATAELSVFLYLEGHGYL